MAEQAQRGVGVLNGLPPSEARAALAAVCASRRWVELVLGARPFSTVEDVLASGRRALAAIDDSDLDEALAGHPRIGERRTGPEGAASRVEQSALAGADEQVLAALAEGNRRYEQRFGHVYLVCATGRSAQELLDVLNSRLDNDAASERQVLREELGKINTIRLNRLLADLGQHP